MKVEYMTLSNAARETLARRQLFKELHILFASKPIIILTNSQIALNISENPANYRQAKHIDIRYHAVKYYIYYSKSDLKKSSLEDWENEEKKIMIIMNILNANMNILKIMIIIYLRKTFECISFL